MECLPASLTALIYQDRLIRMIGSLFQHLKNRFGSGYTLTVRCGVADPEILNNLRQFVESKCPEATLQEGHVSQLQFHLPLKSTR